MKLNNIKIVPPSPHWRQGQTIANFLAWLHYEKDYSPSKKQADPYQISNNQLTELYDEFCEFYKNNNLTI